MEEEVEDIDRPLKRSLPEHLDLFEQVGFREEGGESQHDGQQHEHAVIQEPPCFHAVVSRLFGIVAHRQSVVSALEILT